MSDAVSERHPKGLYVLFATEMWERFTFYTMLGVLTLYMKDAAEGFGFTAERATNIYSWYTAFVYASPLIGGFLADRYLGCRWAITIGGFFFFVGQFLLAVPSIYVFYLGLLFMVTGNGFFKPNVSSMVGHLYSEGSRLKDKAYVIFYMGINVGALLAPFIAEFVKAKYGFRVVFMVAACGMFISQAIFWGFRKHTTQADHYRKNAPESAETKAARAANPMEAVPEWKRICALVVIYLIVIVFWMIFHQNGSTLTYWANDNTDWNFSGIISNAINPFFIVLLSLPLAGFWGWLDKKGLEPSTPMKMTFGMILTGASFLVLYFAALQGGYTATAVSVLRVDEGARQALVDLPPGTRKGLSIDLPSTPIEVEIKGKLTHKDAYLAEIREGSVLKAGGRCRIDEITPGGLVVSAVRKVSPWWLVLAYLILSLGELMLSPMGLALVSKVAPPDKRGLMMGGWFLATAVGNKLTAIGVYWEIWSHAQFFAVLSGMAFVVAVLLFALIRPLKKAMPGV